MQSTWETPPAAEKSGRVEHKPIPKRFVKNLIPDSILNCPSLNAAISLLPLNYNFEIHKCVWRIRSAEAKQVALQLPEGLLMYSLILTDIFTEFADVKHCFVLGDVTYGACCVDDFTAMALQADILIHYGHSCLVPINVTKIPCLYIFVEIKIDVEHLVRTVKLNLSNKNIALMGTIQFSSAIRETKDELEKFGLRVLVPQSKPLSAGEVLGCTATKIPAHSFGSDRETAVVFVADGRFHLEAFMIANPGIRAFRYDPYIGKLFLEEYDHEGMRAARKGAIGKAKSARNWGIVLGTLGRQGNPRILERLENKMRKKGLDYVVVLMSEISPSRISLFEDSVDAWIQIACPRLSIDWGDAFGKPLLTPFEADIALGFVPGWWAEKKGEAKFGSASDGPCGQRNNSCCGGCNGIEKGWGEVPVGEYPMDYYAMDGGEWSSAYAINRVRRPTPPLTSN